MTPDEKIRHPRAHLTHALNHITHKAIRWCTPSIDLTFSQVKNPYASDVSISFESLGYPLDPSGIFQKIYNHAAKAYGADHTLFSVNGSTGSNFMVLRALSKQIPNLRVLSGRNIHRSIAVACEDYGINLSFLETNIDQRHQLFLPNTEEQIYEAVNRLKPHVLLLINPTYEGMCVDLNKIIATIRVRYPKLIVFVDEAWGAHLHFGEKLPVCAMDAGADICVQSTHKQGGSLQQTGMIHWKDGRINSDTLLESYRSLGTTSPSYTLLASLDSARETMAKKGRDKIEHILKIAERLSEGINKIEGFKVVSTNSLKKNYPSVYERDETKVIVDTASAGFNGCEVAKILEKKYGIVAEAFNIKTLLFLVPFRATLNDVNQTVKALSEIAKNPPRGKRSIDFNFNIPTNVPKILETNEVTKLLSSQIEKVALKNAAGRISVEYITPFPPGIPTTIKGEELTKEIVDYYLRLRSYPNIHIIASDSSMQTVRVVK